MRRGGFTLVEVLVGGFILVSILGLAFTWIAITVRTLDVEGRVAAELTERGRAIRQLREDLAGAARAVPDQGGKGFLLELPCAKGTADYVLYDCVAEGGASVLTRTLYPAEGGASGRERLARGVRKCHAELSSGGVWQALIGDVRVDVARRVGR